MTVDTPVGARGKGKDIKWKTEKETKKTKTGEPVTVYVDPSTKDGMDILGQYLEDSRISQEQFYELVGFQSTENQESASAPKGQTNLQGGTVR